MFSLPLCRSLTLRIGVCSSVVMTEESSSERQISNLLGESEEARAWRVNHAFLEFYAFEALFKGIWSPEKRAREEPWSLANYLRWRGVSGIGRIAFVDALSQRVSQARARDPRIRRKARQEIRDALDVMRSWVGPPGRPASPDTWSASEAAAEYLRRKKNSRRPFDFRRQKRDLRDRFSISRELLDDAIRRGRKIEDARPLGDDKPATQMEIFKSFHGEIVERAMKLAQGAQLGQILDLAVRSRKRK